MPLYTYIVTYRGRSHVAQARRSNFKGFIDWTQAVPDLGPGLKQELAYRAAFIARTSNGQEHLVVQTGTPTK